MKQRSNSKPVLKSKKILQTIKYNKDRVRTNFCINIKMGAKQKKILEKMEAGRYL